MFERVQDDLGGPEQFQQMLGGLFGGMGGLAGMTPDGTDVPPDDRPDRRRTTARSPPEGQAARRPTTGRHPRRSSASDVHARLRRSVLAVPGSNPRMMEKAAASAADEVFLDLEDACAPLEKPAARGKVVEALRTHDWHGKTRVVRINQVTSQFAFDDLREVITGAGDAARLHHGSQGAQWWRRRVRRPRAAAARAVTRSGGRAYRHRGADRGCRRARCARTRSRSPAAVWRR